MNKINEVVDKNIDTFSEQYYINESLTLLSIYSDKKVVEGIKLKTEKCYEKCDKIDNDKKSKICNSTCLIKSTGEKIKELKKINCNEKKDPFKCKVKINKTIEKLKNKINEKNQTINKLKSNK